MLGYGAPLVLNGAISAGVLIVFVLYLDKMYKPMRDLSKMTDTVSKASVGYERIHECSSVKAGSATARRASGAAASKGASSSITSRFSYDGGTPC